MESQETYPRPDFEREDPRWMSLNGEWDFLFDDDDIGLDAEWYRNGLPNEIEVKSNDNQTDPSLVEKLTLSIIGSQSLIKNNTFQRKAKTNIKRKINVPFVFQAKASGIYEQDAHEVLWYEREIQDIRSHAEKQAQARLVVRFGAVDYHATVWVNGQFVGDHEGGHVPFDMDITDLASTVSRLSIRVKDSTYALDQARGKQYWGAQPESIFYTPSSGIWQNVWLEVSPPIRISDGRQGTILRSTDIENGELHAIIAVSGRPSEQSLWITLEASFHGVLVTRKDYIQLPRSEDSVKIDISLRLDRKTYGRLPPEIRDHLSWDNPKCFRNGLALWSPAFPSLYDITIKLYSTEGKQIDSVKTQTGMRSLDWSSGDSTFRLNGEPLFQKLCLDQGYWPDTGMTPPNASSCKEDILLAQSMGFNGCRKHQKLEDPLFLYHADHLGFLVWSEMASAYEFSAAYCSRFSKEWKQAVQRDINHPCIVTWTTANESWAYTSLKDNVDQRNHIRSLYEITKALDSTRPINDNCGWEHVCTDLTTFHDYADAPQLRETCSSLQGILNDKAGHTMFCPPIEGKDKGSRHQDGAPVICTEYGGVNIKAQAEKMNEWGYTTASNSEDLLKRIDALTRAVVGEGTEAQGLISGFVWTQFTDIEQEANGLYTFDRKPKIQPSKVKAIFDTAEKIYFEGLARRRKRDSNEGE